MGIRWDSKDFSTGGFEWLYVFCNGLEGFSGDLEWFSKAFKHH